MGSHIVIRGAREHNLKSVDVDIPKNQLVVFTGVSGSGKSSLAFDTLYAEGQRRYIESLSSYARQFLGQFEKAHVDFISSLSPSIAIEQKAASKNPRSTVGTVTEIYDYLRVLFARAGKIRCYQCQREITSQSVDQIVESIMKQNMNAKAAVISPLISLKKGTQADILDQIRREGFQRVRVDGTIYSIDDVPELEKNKKHTVEIVVDRFRIRDDILSRITDSVEMALKYSDGIAVLHNMDTGSDTLFNEKMACIHCGLNFSSLSPQLFSFNSPQGMCECCSGLGTKLEMDENLIVEKHLSIENGAIRPWGKIDLSESSIKAAVMRELCKKYDIDITLKFEELSDRQKYVVLYGTGREKIDIVWENERGKREIMHNFEGVLRRSERLFLQTKSDYVRDYFRQYLADRPCSECSGSRLRKEAVSVFFKEKNIVDVCAMSVKECYEFFSGITLAGNEKQIAEELIEEIRERLGFLNNVGLHYLTLDRSAPTLSGGEAQRIRLASQIGSGLEGVMYVLDEPSIGLHQRDNSRLIETLKKLRDLENTVIVVEHDEDTIRNADHIIDFGPAAGKHGGEVVAQGTLDDIVKSKKSITGKYLSREMIIESAEVKKPGKRWLELRGARLNNLKNVNLKIPVGLLTVVTGVSGSGKSSLINETLYPAAQKHLGLSSSHALYDVIAGMEHFDKVINIDQNPIGRTPRSNPVTYVKAFDHIRNLFSTLPQAKMKGYKAGRFSFNVHGGRCESCQGDGLKRIEMHFLPDVFVKCDVCDGKRFNRETLSVKFKGKNISDVLDLTVNEAMELFENIPAVMNILRTLCDVGLDYIHLGQPSPTLSGGEAQRVKLARELCKRQTGRTLYILDEPTTGLHFDDIRKFLSVIRRLVNAGNTVVIIEHNMDIIKNADYIVDLGPEGGNEGGEIIFEGTVKQILKNKKSYTGEYLKYWLKSS